MKIYPTALGGKKPKTSVSSGNTKYLESLMPFLWLGETHNTVPERGLGVVFHVMQSMD